MSLSLVRFVHIAAVLALFAGLAIEAFAGEPAGNATPRFFRLAAPLTLLSGLYLGARFGVLANGWMRASYCGIVAMIAAGTLGHRSEALRRISLWARAAFGLAVVFLMTAKPDAVVSLVVLGLAFSVSPLVALPIGSRPRPSGRSSTRA